MSFKYRVKGRKDRNWTEVINICFTPFFIYWGNFGLFRLSGNVPVFMPRFNIFVKCWEIAGAAILRYFALILSIPAALLTFRFCS